jgi:FG-GAP-like repeat
MLSRLWNCLSRPYPQRGRAFDRRHRLPLRLEALEDRTLPATTPVMLELPSAQGGEISAMGEVDSFTFSVLEEGRLTVRVTPDGQSTLDSRLTLFGPGGQELVRSDGATLSHLSSQVDQHLTPGDYALRVSGQVTQGPGSTGAYWLQAGFSLAAAPQVSVQAGDIPQLATADLNGDGLADFAVASGNELSVFLGNGDGSFQRSFLVGLGSRITDGTSNTIFFGGGPHSVAVEDLNKDGQLDLAVTGPDRSSVDVFLGNGDGTFQSSYSVDGGFRPVAVALADINGDGWPDLVTASRDTNEVSVVLGTGGGFSQGSGFPPVDGEGPFEAPRTFVVGDLPLTVTSADVNEDGRVDLVTANTDGTISVLLGDGSGSFEAPRNFTAGQGLNSVVVTGVNGDDWPDLVTANSLSDDVSVLLGKGDGSFEPEQRFAVGRSPKSVIVADVNEDGRSDLVTTNSLSDTVSILLGNDHGSFEPERRYAAGASPSSVVVEDFNQDGRLDLITLGISVLVLLGNGDGSFQNQTRFAVGTEPLSVVVTDVNGDGRPDVITANASSDDVSVLLGGGNGSFEPERRFSSGPRPVSLAVTDLNGDGRQDLVTANQAGNDVAVFLGNGDGSFQSGRSFMVGLGPNAVVLADVDGDGRLDALTANSDSNDVSVLLGNGDGSFQSQILVEAGSPINVPGPPLFSNEQDHLFQDPLNQPIEDPRRDQEPPVLGPRTVAVADLNEDGRLDLVTVNGDSKDVSVLLGRGDGSFEPERRFAAGVRVTSARVADLNGDQFLDLATDDVILLGNGDGSFQDAGDFSLGGVIRSVTDLNGDGRPDPVTFLPSRGGAGNLFVFLGEAGGSFRSEPLSVSGDVPSSVAVADLNGDQVLDLVLAYSASDDVSVILGNPALEQPAPTFLVAPTPERFVAPRQTPHRGDLDQDGTPDIVVLDGAGQILFRRGLPGTDNLFAPPVLINGDGPPAHDITLLQTATGLAVAASDDQSHTVSIYTFRGQPELGTDFTRGSFVTGGLVQERLAVADLDGDGLDDLVILDNLGNSITIALQKDDSFTSTHTVAVGATPSDVTFADLDGQEGLDIIVSNQSSGDVVVLFNDSGHAFTQTARYRANTTLSLLQEIDGQRYPQSREGPVSIVAGFFTADVLPDLVVVDRGSHTIRTLIGLPGGGLTNPQEAFRFSTSQGLAINDRPGQAVTEDFDGDGRLDVAILMEDRGEVWLYRGLGDGNFVLLTRIGAGLSPTGLSADDLNGDGLIDLLVGNGFGDILFILSNGDGSFRPFVRVDQRVPFIATDLDGDGTLDVVLADQGHDLALAQIRTPGTDSFTPGAFQRDGQDGLIGPGAVAEADLDGLYGTDLVFANSGSNNVLVYLRQADGSFAETPLSFFAGTSPSGLHIGQFNDDNDDGVVDPLDLPDLAVANQGSNDVSVLLGSRDESGNWTFRPGQRLLTGGLGPNAVTSIDSNNDGIPDLFATNGQDGTFATIPGLPVADTGSGLFGTASVSDPIVQGAIRQTQIVSPTVGFALTQQGTILGFNPSTGTTVTVFTPTAGNAVNAFQTLTSTSSPFPLLFTANADGTASLLSSGDGQTFVENDTAATGFSNLNALEVLEIGERLFEVYLTDAGVIQPVVLTLSLRTELTLGDNLFVPVATLLTDLSGGPSPSVSSLPGASVEVFNPLLVSLLQVTDVGLVFAPAAAPGEEERLALPDEALTAILLGLPASGGGNLEEEDEDSEPPSVTNLLSGLYELLERLSGAEPTDTTASDNRAPIRPAATEPAEGSLQWLLKAVEKLPPDERNPAPGAEVVPADFSPAPSSPPAPLGPGKRSALPRSEGPQTEAARQAGFVSPSAFLPSGNETPPESFLTWEGRRSSLASAVSAVLFAASLSFHYCPRRNRSISPGSEAGLKTSVARARTGGHN